MSEDGDFQPASWATSDFSAARRAYDASAGRSYAEAVRVGKTAKDVVPASITTKSKSPVFIGLDETGSMGEWPGIICSKLPYLVHEVSNVYLFPDTEISFGAFGDAYNDEDYPLQIQPFGQNEELLSSLRALIIEKLGGAGYRETAELMALYLLHNAHTPNAEIKPVGALITDEAPYQEISVAAARFAKVNLQRPVSTREVFQELLRSWEIFIILKQYGNPSTAQLIQKEWEDLVGVDRVVRLPEPERVVDVIFGILAKVTAKADYFRLELTSRQRPAQVKTVLQALQSIDIDATPSMKLGALSSGKSVIPELGDGKKSKPLL